MNRTNRNTRRRKPVGIAFQYAHESFDQGTAVNNIQYLKNAWVRKKRLFKIKSSSGVWRGGKRCITIDNL